MEFMCETIDTKRDSITSRINGYRIFHGDSKEKALEICVDRVEGITFEELD